MYYAKDYKNNSNSNANLNNRYRNKYESEQFDSSQNNLKNPRYTENYRNYQRGTQFVWSNSYILFYAKLLNSFLKSIPTITTIQTRPPLI